jgi:hypothetical protein
MKKNVVWFYIIWASILSIGDVLCWGTADYFWVHDNNNYGDFFFWLLWLVSIVSASKMILNKLKWPKTV